MCVNDRGFSGVFQASIKALRGAQFAVDAGRTFTSLDDVRHLANGEITVYCDSLGSVTIRPRLQPKVAQTVQQHVSYEFIWRRRTRDYI